MSRLAWQVLNFFQAIFLGLWTAFWISAALLVQLLTRNPDHPLLMARTCWAPGLLFFAGARLEIEGAEGIDWSKPHIFLMYHQSAIDIPVAFATLRTPLRFLAKHSLAKVPFVGWYMRATRMVFVDRATSAQAAVASIQHAGQRIREGASILTYPEGTRSRDSRMLPFKKGAFVVAVEAQVPVVPVVIHGADQVLSSTGFRVRPGTIRVRIGPPIPTAGLVARDREALLRQVYETMVEMHRDIGGAGGEPLPAPRRSQPRPAQEPADQPEIESPEGNPRRDTRAGGGAA
jgi:1-acyl-sn-glycerol-3-phosphate acyltransferase